MNENFKDIQYIAINEINKPDENPDFIGDELNEMTTSIIKKGITNPILVKKNNNKYDIVDGNKRYTASILAGLRAIPALIVDGNYIKEHKEELEKENIEEENIKTNYEMEDLKTSSTVEVPIDSGVFVHDETKKGNIKLPYENLGEMSIQYGDLPITPFITDYTDTIEHFLNEENFKYEVPDGITREGYSSMAPEVFEEKEIEVVELIPKKEKEIEVVDLVSKKTGDIEVVNF